MTAAKLCGIIFNLEGSVINSGAADQSQEVQFLGFQAAADGVILQSVVLRVEYWLNGLVSLSCD